MVEILDDSAFADFLLLAALDSFSEFAVSQEVADELAIAVGETRVLIHFAHPGFELPPHVVGVNSSGWRGGWEGHPVRKQVHLYKTSDSGFHHS